LGFKELQKSAWIFPYDIKKDIEELMEIAKYNTQGDIRFLTVEKIEEDDDLKKWFGFK
jgi:DNA-binding transcriptional regulator PaaX